MNLFQESVVSVDAVYDAMNNGERIHMANKLHKHGYLGSLTSEGKLGQQSLERLVEDFIAYGITASDVVRMFERVQDQSQEELSRDEEQEFIDSLF